MFSKYHSQLAIEAIVVGIITVIVMALLQRVSPMNPLLMFFVGGVLIHLGCEVSGINKFYCSKGAACLKQ